MAASRDVKTAQVAGPLQNVSVAYRNRSYIADRVFPIIERVPAKAKILLYKKGAWFRDEAGIRAAKTEARRGGVVTDSVNVLPQEWAFASEVPDEDRKNAKEQGAPPVQPDQDAIELATDKVDLAKERRVRDLIIAGNWCAAGVGGFDCQGRWKAGVANSFLTDISDKSELIRSKCGIKPNRLIIDYGTYQSLKQEDTLLDRIKFTQRGVLSMELIAAIVELEQILIGEAIKSTAVEKKDGTDFTAVNIWEKNAGKGMGFLYYAPSSPGLKVPSVGYQAREWYPNGSARQVLTWREDSRHQDVYEVDESTDIVACDTDLGYLWYDTLAT